ncbi:MAG: VanZ family protein [Flavobacteriales bacterium]
MLRSFKYREYFKAAQFIWAAFVFIIHLMPVDRDDIRRFDFPYADKWIHGLLFFILAALAFLSTSQRRKLLNSFLIVFIACLAYGGLLEYMQYTFTEERSGDILDWLADAAGALAGIGCAKLIDDRITLQS